MKVETLIYIYNLLKKEEDSAYEEYKYSTRIVHEMEKEEDIECWKEGSEILELSRETRRLKLEKYNEAKAALNEFRSMDWH